MTGQNTLDELLGINQVARSKMLRGPFAAFRKLDSQEMAAVTECAVAHCPDQFSISVIH